LGYIVPIVDRERRTQAGPFTITQVGFAAQPFAFELVPLELMKDNPDGLDLATPSIAFAVDDLDAAHAGMVGRGVPASEVGEHGGRRSFAFADPEGSLVRRHCRLSTGTPCSYFLTQAEAPFALDGGA
jgi:catechol 2,3-dioxygenase-like lactoylglutathione lyase family enzyme